MDLEEVLLRPDVHVDGTLYETNLAFPQWRLFFYPMRWPPRGHCYDRTGRLCPQKASLANSVRNEYRTLVRKEIFRLPDQIKKKMSLPCGEASFISQSSCAVLDEQSTRPRQASERKKNETQQRAQQCSKCICFVNMNNTIFRFQHTRTCAHGGISVYTYR